MGVLVCIRKIFLETNFCNLQLLFIRDDYMQSPNYWLVSIILKDQEFKYQEK